MRKKFAQNLQWQYFISYLVVMLVTMTVFFAYAYNSFSEFHAKSVIDDYTDRLGMVRDEQENAIENMVAIAGQIMSVTSDVPFDFYEDPEDGLNLVRHLLAYRATNDEFDGIYIHFYDDDFVYTPTGSILMDNFVSNTLLLDNIDEDEIVGYFEDTTMLTILPVQTVQGRALFGPLMSVKRMVPIFVPVSVSGGLKCGTAMFLVSDSIYENWFDVLYMDEENVYVFKNGELIISSQSSSIPYDTVKAASDADEISLEYENSDYRLIKLDNQRFGFSYVMAVPDEELHVGMSTHVKMLMVLTAFVGALGILFIHYFVRRRMQPIKQLHSMVSDNTSGGNELNEIRDGIQHLIDENNAMTSRMEDVSTLRKSEFVRRFLTGMFATEDEFLAEAESINLNVDVRLFAVSIIARPLETDYELTADKINHLFDGEVAGVARSLGMQGRIVVLSFADTAQALTDFINMKFMGMRACCTGVTMAVSAYHGDFHDGQRAYLEAENAFELRFVKGNESPLYFDGIKRHSGIDTHVYQQSVDRLHTSLHTRDGAAVNRTLKEITAAMRSMQVSLFDFRCMYNDILNVVSSEARASGVNEEDVYDLFKLSQCLSLDDLDTMLHNVCSRLLSNQSSTVPVDVADGVVAAHEIIEKRFSEPGLSVSSIASDVGMTDSRLSTDFKKAYRMTPLEYITMCRMQRARRLLHTTDMPVKDIAVECGYYDISGFNRRFKAYTGMTPQQYRQSGDQEQESQET